MVQSTIRREIQTDGIPWKWQMYPKPSEIFPRSKVNAASNGASNLYFSLAMAIAARNEFAKI